LGDTGTNARRLTEPRRRLTFYTKGNTIMATKGKNANATAASRNEARAPIPETPSAPAPAVESTVQSGDSPVVAEGLKILDEAAAQTSESFGHPYVSIYADHNDVHVLADSEKPGHDYVVCKGESHDSLLHIEFQCGPIKEAGINGVQNEHLLAVLIHRTQQLNDQFPCDENLIAIRHMKQAIQALQSRTANRIARGVEGQNKV
jgi:hypothetical protein